MFQSVNTLLEVVFLDPTINSKNVLLYLQIMLHTWMLYCFPEMNICFKLLSLNLRSLYIQRPVVMFLCAVIILFYKLWSEVAYLEINCTDDKFFLLCIYLIILCQLSGVRSPLGSPRPQDSGTHPHKTHSQHKYALPIQEISEASSHESGRSRHGSVHTPESGHKDAWLTPRVTPAQGRVILSTTPREGVMRDLPPSQESAVDNVKTMLEEENLSSMQQRTLESVRSALQKISDDPVLTDVQLERTLTIISLASQLTEESLQLGVLPDTMFEQFADINSRAMSDLGISEDDFRVSETPNPPMELLRPLTRDSLNTRDEVPHIIPPPTAMHLLTLSPITKTMKNLSSEESQLNSRKSMQFLVKY